MSLSEQESPRRWRRVRGGTGILRRHWLVLAGLVLLVGIVSAALLWPAPDEEEGTATSSDAPEASTSKQTSSEPEPESESSSSDSDTAVRDLVEADEAIRQPDAEDVDVDAVAQDFVKGELQATEALYAERGWHQEGSVTVADVRTVEQDDEADPPTVTLEVCLDSSEVSILDESGDPVREDDDMPDRVPHLYTLQQTDSGWKAADHSFPNESSC